MSISSAGIGSGLDVNAIVSQLMAVESIPLNNLFDDRTKAETDISAYGQMKSFLSTFKDSVTSFKKESDFITNTASSSDKDILSISATQEAVSGTYDITVLELAKQHKLRSNSFASGSTDVGTGTLTISVGSNSFSVAIDDESKTLAGIKNAINGASDNKGITASIVTISPTSSKLVLTSDGLGSDNEIKILVSNDGSGDTDLTGLSQLAYEKGVTTNLTEDDAATDASFSIDGDTITRSTNTITDVLEGVTIDLVKKDDVTPANNNIVIKISQSYGATTVNVNNIINSYNDLTSAIGNMREQGYSGSSLLRNIENNIRELFTKTPSSIKGEVDASIKAGLSFDKDGVLSLDADSLNDATKNNFNDLVNYFTDSTDGFSFRLESLMDDYIATDGVLETSIDNLRIQSLDYDDKIEQFNARLLVVEQRYRAQFINLDVLMSQFSATSSYLSQQLDGLKNSNTQISNR